MIAHLFLLATALDPRYRLLLTVFGELQPNRDTLERLTVATSTCASVSTHLMSYIYMTLGAKEKWYKLLHQVLQVYQPFL